MKHLLSRWGVGRLALLPLLGLLFACSSGGTDPIADDLIVGGLVLRLNGVSVASVRGTQVTGGVTVPEQSTSGLIAVTFVDHEGVEFTPFANEKMEVSIADESVATFAQEGTFTGRLTGVVAGTTSMTFRFVQGGVTIYTSLAIPVTVIGPS